MGRERKQRIDGIQPFAQLAEGNTTTVYKGYQERLDRFVLLKVLRPALARDEELARRFEEEAQLVAQIQHPNVVTIYDYGRTEDEQTYLATEFIEGTDLRGLLGVVGLLPPALAALVLREAATGLRAAHERGILHRDLKPANVLLDDEGHAKVSDFGIARERRDAGGTRVLDDREPAGTEAWMAPEVRHGVARADEASDVYGCATLLHACLAGEPPDPEAGPAIEGVPEALQAVLERGLARRPGDRYDAARALAGAIAEVRSS